MTKGELESAVRRALNIFDEWVDVTGALAPGTSYYYEMQSCIVEAVHCGAQAETGDFRKLDSEPKLPTHLRRAMKARRAKAEVAGTYGMRGIALRERLAQK